MQQSIAFSWCCCCLLYTVLLSVEGLYIPTYRTRLSQVTSYEQWKRASTDWRDEDKRTHSQYETFMDSMARQAQRRHHRDRHAFVEEMFRIFDINRDSVIERYEFRAILQVMGVVPSSRMMFG